MPTTNSNFSTLITAIDTKARSLAASTTDAKDLVFLGKAIEALNIPSYSFCCYCRRRYTGRVSNY